jgi:four helix bundle protein
MDTSKGPQGYKKLIVWQNAYKLRKRVYEIAKNFPRHEYRRIAQINDAARSVKQNIQEGYKQKSLGKYIYYLGSCSQPSLAELQGDIEDSFDDGLIDEKIFQELNELAGKTDYY